MPDLLAAAQASARYLDPRVLVVFLLGHSSLLRARCVFLEDAELSACNMCAQASVAMQRGGDDAGWSRLSARSGFVTTSAIGQNALLSESNECVAAKGAVGL